MNKVKIFFVIIIMLFSFISISFSEVNLNSPQEIGQYIHDNIQYTKDNLDHWQRPEETLSRGKGDCEDIALLAKYYLNKIGIKTRIIMFTGTKNEQDKCHCICVMLESNGTYSQVGQKYFNVYCKTVREVVNASAERLKYDEVLEVYILNTEYIEKKIIDTETNHVDNN